MEKYRLLFGDILYTEGGDKDKLGRGTIWKNEIVNCIHQNHIFRARPKSGSHYSKYIAPHTTFVLSKFSNFEVEKTHSKRQTPLKTAKNAQICLLCIFILRHQRRM